MPETGHLTGSQRGFALGLVFICLMIMFIIAMSLYISFGAEQRTSRRLVPSLAAQYLAESAVQMAVLKIVELSGPFTRAVKQNNKGNDRYLSFFLSDITSENFKLRGTGTFSVSSLNLLTGSGHYSDKMVIMVKAEGNYLHTTHRLEKMMELSVGGL